MTYDTIVQPGDGEVAVARKEVAAGNTVRAGRMQSAARLFLVYASYWYLLGPAFGVALQLYVNYRFGLVQVIGGATFPDIICIFSCIVLAGYIAVASFASLQSHRVGIAWGAAACGVLSVLGMQAPALPGWLAGLLPIASMMLFSSFFMSHLLLWFEVFSCHENMLTLIYILVLSSLANFLCWFLIGLEGSRLLCALVGAVVLGSAMLHKSFRSTTELDSPQTDVQAEPHGHAWLPGGSGVLVATFFFGLGFLYTTSFMSLEDFHNSHDWSTTLYALGLCAAVLVFSRQIRISTLYYLATMLTIAGSMLALFDNPLGLPSGMLSEVGLFTYLVFVLVLYCAISHERNSKSPQASCLLIIALYLGLFAGRQLFATVDALIDADTKLFLHALIAVFIVMLLVVCTMIGLRTVSRIVSSELSSPGFAHITAYESSAFSARIAAIYRLSERECEVLCLMLENKSATEIAEAMVIAHGTAKAHINNIYKKLDIHTREELFAMIPGRLE